MPPLPHTTCFFSTPPRPPSSTLFPYTTLFRSPFTSRERTLSGCSWSSLAPTIHLTVIQRPKVTTLGLAAAARSEEHTSELQSRFDLVCRLLLEKKKNTYKNSRPSYYILLITIL